MNVSRVGHRSLLPPQSEYISNAICEMKKAGHTNVKDLVHILMYPNLFFVFASENDKATGMMACSVQLQTSTCHVLLAYVSPEKRKQGVFKAMLNEIKKKEVNPNFSWSKITFGVMTINKTMQYVMRASGAAPEATMYTIPLS